jgi:hypothetical protein
MVSFAVSIIGSDLPARHGAMDGALRRSWALAEHLEMSEFRFSKSMNVARFPRAENV